jgi:hypothetical protein
MRLIKTIRLWFEDKNGFVLVFSALVLPIILLLGVLVLQSGQLYGRQSQLQFIVRQASSSGLVPLAELLKNQAEVRYQAQCFVELPPAQCETPAWTDFITVAEAKAIANQPSSSAMVQAEVQNFIAASLGKTDTPETEVILVFPITHAGLNRISARVQLIEPQTSWLGNVLRPDDYRLKAEAVSYLDLQQ